MKKFLLLITMVTTLALTACGQGSKGANDPAPANNSQAGGSTEPTEQQTKLVLGTSADYAPYEFQKMIDGKNTIVGFDIEIAKEIAKDMNAELVIQNMDFDGLLMALNAGKVDMVISGMTPTPERAENVDFSEIYYYAEQGVLVKKDRLAEFPTLESLSGKKVGVQKGSIQEGIAQEIEGAKLTSLGKIPELIMELQTGRVDALILEKPVADQYVLKQDDIALADAKIEQPKEESGAAVAVKKGNAELLENINKTLERLMAAGDIDRFVVEANELVGE
ncbi:amino acid ABC transporter [Paenibacillus sambharensis]|uniref:Amino acid ABC transporter n=1 Tax=Paenibacillus sambharensis TaxID=1803190 RepID=A0A2W1L8Z0_9BACL|nr:ABC transporter substrate-binding protein [Paenibacillus sambharensis]PZD95383.1 amino acid ABC transporter [Paenibacillus sambharensis]